MVKQKTIFSRQRHAASLHAKKIGYNFSKTLLVGTLVVGLLGVGTFQALAGSNKHNGGGQKHTIKNVKKTTIKAKAGNKNHYGNSNSQAHVDNSVRINTGGTRGGGAAASLNRGNGGKKNGNNNNHKRVVRKKVVKRTVDNSYVDNSYKEVDVNVKQVNECGDCYNNSVEYTYKKPVHSYPTYHKDYDHEYDNEKDYSYRKSKSATTTYVENNNNSDNYNDNSQYLEVSLPHYYD